MAQKQQIAILGASGYTGAELVRILASHPSMNIRALSAERKAGQNMGSVFPHLRHLDLPKLVKIEQIDFTDISLCFCALPHKTSQQVIAKLPKNLKIVDLSADYRLADPQAYADWYGQAHCAPDLQKTAVYGLTEFYREQIKSARLVACTGCNAAAGQYALRPLIEKGIIDLDAIIIDLKTGVSGAGRAAREHLLHAELSEGAHPYAIGGAHRHLAEFDQEFTRLAGRSVSVQFCATLLPANRGIIANVFVRGDARAIYDCLADAYAAEPFLVVLPFGEAPSSRHIRGSNYCHIGVCGDRVAGRGQVMVALDNLTKGSSGQAVQNANLMLGLDEAAGLLAAPIFP